MLLLHTSDWHVGRTFHGRDLLAEQEAVLGGLADLVTTERVDVVVVAGDLYDRAVPNAEAVQTCARVLSRIRSAGAKIVVTPGNHDSAARIGVFGEFTAAGGLHTRCWRTRSGPWRCTAFHSWSRNPRGRRWACPRRVATRGC
jgi:DNA repair protein SbcD/Mre11